MNNMKSLLACAVTLAITPDAFSQDDMASLEARISELESRLAQTEQVAKAVSYTHLRAHET